MKKFLVLLLALMLVFAFAACGNEPAVDEDTAPEESGEVSGDAIQIGAVLRSEEHTSEL